MASNNSHPDCFICVDEIHEEVRKIKTVRAGDGTASLARAYTSSDEVDKYFNAAVTYQKNAAAPFQATSSSPYVVRPVLRVKKLI